MATKNTRDKHPTSRVRMINTVKKVVEGKPLAVAMRESGYSPSYADNPQMLARREEFQKLLQENRVSIGDIALVHGRLLASKREDIQLRAVDIGYKVHGRYEQAHTANVAVPIQINIIPPSSERIREIVDGGEDSTPIAP